MNPIVWSLCLSAVLLLAGCGGDSVFGGGTDAPGGELGPEFTTPPVIENVTISPTDPVDREPVTVRANLSCPYGFNFVHIVYQLDGEETTTVVGERRFTDGSVTAVDYEGMIPGQRTGSIVKYFVFARSAYGIGMASPVSRYVVSNSEATENL